MYDDEMTESALLMEFALAALNGILAAGDPYGTSQAAAVAAQSYKIADAMLAEHKKRMGVQDED